MKMVGPRPYGMCADFEQRDCLVLASSLVSRHHNETRGRCSTCRLRGTCPRRNSCPLDLNTPMEMEGRKGRPAVVDCEQCAVMQTTTHSSFTRRVYRSASCIRMRTPRAV